MIRRITGLALVVAASILAGCKTDPARALLGKPFPDFRFAASGNAGDSVSLQQLKGNPALIVFWATWCGPCRDEVTELRKLYAKYESRGVKIVGLSIDESPAPVPLMIQQLSIPYPVGTGALPFFDSLRLESIPQIYLLDRHGRVVDAFGAAPEGVLSRAVDLALAAK